jgi:hypothetical protein
MFISKLSLMQSIWLSRFLNMTDGFINSVV